MTRLPSDQGPLQQRLSRLGSDPPGHSPPALALSGYSGAVEVHEPRSRAFRPAYLRALAEESARTFPWVSGTQVKALRPTMSLKVRRRAMFASYFPPIPPRCAKSRLCEMRPLDLLARKCL